MELSKRDVLRVRGRCAFSGTFLAFFTSPRHGSATNTQNTVLRRCHSIKPGPVRSIVFCSFAVLCEFVAFCAFCAFSSSPYRGYTMGTARRCWLSAAYPDGILIYPSSD